MVALCLALAALAALVCASPAAAQDPARPTRAELRAQARAYAAAALVLQAELKRLEPRLDALLKQFDTPGSCFTRAVRGVHEGEVPELAVLLLYVDIERQIGDLLGPPVERFTTRLAAAPSADRILNAGADVWEADAASFNRLRTLPRNGCGLFAEWRRKGFKESAAPPELARALKVFSALDDVDEQPLVRAERRLLQLGASSRGARAFGPNILGDGEGEYGESGFAVERLLR